MPDCYQDKFILSSYRPAGITATQSVLSIFQWHNETLNFWTHFLVFAYFAWTCYKMDVPFFEDKYHWPLLCVGISLCLYPLLSSVAHVFSSMNLKVRHFVFYLDYMGISVYSCAASMAFLAYSSPEHVRNSTMAYVYTYICVVLVIISFIGCCLSRHCNDTNSTKGVVLRVAAFAVPFLFVCAFMMHWLLYHKSSPIEHHYLHILWNPAVGLVPASRLPERLVPVSFDVIGQSHQLFHITSFIATKYQFEAVIKDCFLKRGRITTDLVSRLSVEAFLLVLFIDSFILCYFSIKLYRSNRDYKKIG